MRIVAFLSFIVLLNLNAKAQWRNYIFKKLNQQYTVLTNPIYIEKDTLWYDTSYQYLGYEWYTGNSFQFPFNNETINSFTFSPYFKTTSGYYPPILRINGNVNKITINLGGSIRMQEPNQDSPYVSSFAIELDTLSNPKVLKFQLKDIGLTDSTRSIKGKLNIQLWLFENGTIEYHFGEINAPDIVNYSNKHSFRCNLNNVNSDSSNIYGLIAMGSSNNPTIYYINDKDSIKQFNSPDSVLSNYPLEGTIYQFKLGNNSVDEAYSNSDIYIYPNPVVDNLYIHGINENINSYSIHNIQGETIQCGQLEVNDPTSIQRLPSGMYFIKIFLQEGHTIKKFIKP